MVSFEWSELQQALENLAVTPAQRERVVFFVEDARVKFADAPRMETLELILFAAHFVQHGDPQALIDEHRALSRPH